MKKPWSWLGLILGSGVIIFLLWILLPFVVNRTSHDVSPLVPTSTGNIPVLPDPSLMPPELMKTGAFMTRAHDTSGLAQLIETNSGTLLRLENLDTLNGPDLRVYLATDETASESLDLGQLKANRGDMNYVIPDDTDLNKYPYVLIWCRAFSVLFGSAELEAMVTITP
ncbi:MAG: hypothetical protein JW384_01026 [Nitrosomonadaceae bacterium]|nr:hypothetical protein [Nitrosomonadaceae bacterium]